MGRITQGHVDDVFLNKIKQVCIHVLDQLNEANEIDQAFDLCPSISRRNRVILSFLRDADQLEAASTSSPHTVAASFSSSPPLDNLRPPDSIRPSREPSLGTDSVASLSALRRRRAREMQYVRDPNDSNDDSDSQATVGPSYSSHAHLDPASARTPSMSQPDYTFEQFADHLDPTDKLLKRSFEIIIKETACQALAKKRDPNYDPATASSRSSADPAASLRSAIASSRSNRMASSSRAFDDTSFARRMTRVPNTDPDLRSSNMTTSALDSAYHLLRSNAPQTRPFNTQTDSRDQSSVSSRTPERTIRRTLRDFLLASTQGRLASTQDDPTFASRSSRPSSSSSSFVSRRDVASGTPGNSAPQFAHRRSIPRPSSTMGISPQLINARLAEASRRNAEADRTIDDAERLRSSQFIRTSIESLRASLFQLHIDLASTQLQQAHNDHFQQQRNHAESSLPDIGASYALVMDTIELFDDTLRRLSCLVSNTATSVDHNVDLTTQPANTQRNADSSQMRTSLWRARNLLLLSSMTRRANQSESAPSSHDASALRSRDAELRAHRHLLATIEESHWSRADVQAPSHESIRAWRRKLAAWYHLDRDRASYPDAPPSAGDHEESYARWHPDLELPYALDDEILAPMTSDPNSARPDPISDPSAAWAFARRHDASLHNNLNQDAEVRAALESASVASARDQILRLHRENEVPLTATSGASVTDAGNGLLHLADSAEGLRVERSNNAVTDLDPDVSLTRTTSLTRRNAMRGLPVTNSDASSIRSARSSLSLRRARDSSSLASRPVPEAPPMPPTTTRDDNDAVEEEVVETSFEIEAIPHSPEASSRRQARSLNLRQSSQQPSDDGAGSSLLPPSERPRTGRSGSFTFISTPAAVLRSRQRGHRSQSPVPTRLPGDDDDDDDDDDVDVLDDPDSEAEDYIDLDLDLGMAGDDAFEFDLVDFLRTESRRASRRENDNGADSDSADASPPYRRQIIRTRDRDGASHDSREEDEDASRSGVRVFVSGSGASTPAEARQATFEAYAQRSRLLERRRRRLELERQGLDRELEEIEDGTDRARSGGNGPEEPSPDSRRRRRGRNVGDDMIESESNVDRRNSLPFPGISER